MMQLPTSNPTGEITPTFDKRNIRKETKPLIKRLASQFAMTNMAIQPFAERCGLRYCVHAANDVY